MNAERISILGVPVTDVTMKEALELLDGMIQERPQRSHCVYFVNAHTLNLACDDHAYREILCSADRVFGDGTGVRWGIRGLHHRRLRDNVNGTDLVPRLLQSHPERHHRYFMLGTTPERIERAANYASTTFSAWTLAGYHHGYVDAGDSERLVQQINDTQAQLLLVGMGNPLQEQWIHKYRHLLHIPICMGIGGLFDYWSGDLDRAPRWMRAIGYEWVHLLLRQPRKAGRYLLGNPRFLFRIANSKIRGDDRKL